MDRARTERLLQEYGWTQIKISKPSGPVVELHLSMSKWCEDYIGSGRLEPNLMLDDQDVWYSFTWYGYWSYHFKHSKDATVFAVRWSS